MAYIHQREKLSDVTRDLVAVALGRKAADLLIKDGKLVNVNIGRIQEHIDVAVSHGFIAYVGPSVGILTDEHTKIVDAKGRYIVPGFIDGHMHIEDSMVDPREFVRHVLPAGVTTLCPDNHEITNVLGLKAVELFHKAGEGLPVKFLLAMPVCVPSQPGMEDAGAVITPEDVDTAYREGWAQMQGEQMSFTDILAGNEFTHAINNVSLNYGKVMMGHFPMSDTGQGLNAFIASGQNCCHELTGAESALRRAELGMYAQMRYGTSWLDLPDDLHAVLDHPGIDDRFFCLATDDVSAKTLVEEGQLLRVVRKAIKCGLNPIKAVQFATINTAQMLEKARWIGSISPSKAADILIVSDLMEMNIDEVYSDGVLVADHGTLTVDIPSFDYPDWALHTVYMKSLTPADFRISSEGMEKCLVRVMGTIPGMAPTIEKEAVLTAKNGELCADVEQDIAKLAVFYRHAPRPDVTKDRAFGFLSGTGFRAGCAYATTVSHDCHNLFVVGTDDEAMCTAANYLIEKGGGVCMVKDGKVAASVELPLAGLMSLKDAGTVAAELSRVTDAMKEAGCPHSDYEMVMSFLGLVVIPELHISNRGLVELKEGAAPRFVDCIIREEPV